MAFSKGRTLPAYEIDGIQKPVLITSELFQSFSARHAVDGLPGRG
jgi:hypothetical protein